MMSCEYCRQYPHDPRCPNHISENPKEYCTVCEGGIYPGEKYIENIFGDFAHYECLCCMTTRELTHWLGHEIKNMKDN